MDLPYEHRHRGPLFWFVITAIGSVLAGVLFAGVTFIVLFAVILVLVARLTTFVPGASFTFPGLTNTTGRSNQTVLLTPSHVWTGESNPAVVDEAVHIASAIYNGPPDGLGTWYNAAAIPDAVVYWQRTCPGCSEWQQGNLQCVMLVTAAYGLAGQPLPYVGNAITFFTSGAYLNRPGWEELTPDSMPEPGDMVVFNSPFFDGSGHIAIVADVSPPTPGRPGYVQFVEANGPGSLVQEPLTQDSSGKLHMQIWPRYTVMCYIRHVSSNQST